MRCRDNLLLEYMYICFNDYILQEADQKVVFKKDFPTQCRRGPKEKKTQSFEVNKKEEEKGIKEVSKPPNTTTTTTHLSANQPRTNLTHHCCPLAL